MPRILLALYVDMPSFKVIYMSYCRNFFGTRGFFFEKLLFFVKTTIFSDKPDYIL